MDDKTRVKFEGEIKQGTVLIAEDTPVMRKACQRALERAGHNVLLAEDGNRALQILRNDDVDVALLDIKMPGMSGIEVLKTIKAEKPLVEVIMMTAYATEGAAEEALRIGAADFLTKPFNDVKSLVKTINDSIARKRLKESVPGGGVPDVGIILLKEGLVTETQLEQARSIADEWKTTLSRALIKMGILAPQDIDQALAKAVGMAFVHLNADQIDRSAVEMAPSWLVRRYRVMPFKIEDRSLHVAVDDPFDSEGIETLESITGCKVVAAKGAGHQISAMIRAFYPQGPRTLEELVREAKAENENLPARLREIIETAVIRSVDKLDFEREGAGWRFAIEGLIEERGKKKAETDGEAGIV